MAKIYPSLIAANPLYLHQTIKTLEPYCAGFHCDIMDNHFVSNLTFGFDIVQAIDAATFTQTWVHLMVDNPADWCKRLILKPHSIVSFHFESTNEPDKVIKCIKEKKWLPSIAINPKTDEGEIFHLLDTISQILIMSVNPGFSGQPFLDTVLKKIPSLIYERKKRNLTFSIGIDGGINAKNIISIAQQGAQDLAIASAIFNTPDPLRALQSLSQQIECIK